MAKGKWLVNIAIKKMIKRAVQLVIAYVGAEKLAQSGVTLDPNQLVLATYAGLEGLRNYLKTNKGWDIL